MEKLTIDELKTKLTELVEDYNNLKGIINEAYNAMLEISEEYKKIINELENRESELHPPKGRVLPDSMTSLA